MHTDAFGEIAENIPPIELVTDECVSQKSILEAPGEAFYHFSTLIHDKVGLIEDSGLASPELIADITYALAFRNALLHPMLFTAEALKHESEAEAKMLRAYDERLEQYGISMTAIELDAQKLSIVDVMDYHLSKLETFTNYLHSGQVPDNWPGAMRDDGHRMHHSETITEVRTIAETVVSTMPFFIEDEPELQLQFFELINRHQDWAQDTCDLLLENGKIGLATPLINTIVEDEIAIRVVNKLTKELQSVHDLDGREPYRRLHRFIRETLLGYMNKIFLMSNKQVPILLTYGANQTMNFIGETTVLSEQFERGVLVHAETSDGKPVILPNKQFINHVTFNYGSDKEYDFTDAQNAVSFDELDDQAKLAIDLACEAESTGRFREDTLPLYRRLALKPKNTTEGKPTLHTVTFRPDHHRRIHPMPDDHGFVTSDHEPNIAWPVESAVPVADTWLVAQYHGEVGFMTTYKDVEPNIYGPGEEKANAFWIAGTPRVVVGNPGDRKLMRPDDETGLDERARWVIMPVRYYWVKSLIS